MTEITTYVDFGRVGGEKSTNTAIIKLVEEIEVKNRHTQKKKLFEGIVYVQYWCPDEDDTVQEDECSRVCLYRENKKRNSQANTSVVFFL